MILDSCFVIALEREAKRGAKGRATGPALQFLDTYNNELFQITFTIAGELACGDSMAQKAEWKRLLRPFHIIPWSTEISWQYGECFRFLKKRGPQIGANDLWIAATALAHDQPLVTNNLSEFSRIPGLNIVPFEF